MELAWQALDSADGQALPADQWEQLRAALERVAQAERRGEERAAVRLLQRQVDRDRTGSPAVARIGAAADSAAGCVLELPVG